MHAHEPTLDALVEAARAGSRQAMETVSRHIQDDVYRLALKMLWHPEDARDAAQEILIRVITHLGSFRGESAFTTWVYRIAANYLLSMRKRRAERHTLSFAEFGADLYDGLSETPLSGASEADQRLLVEEVKRGCTQGMLLCLDRAHRIAYILGEVFQLTGTQGGDILGITPAAFRKRLSRARTSIRDFMQQRCGLINKANGCRCRRRVHRAVELGRVAPGHLLFATHPAYTYGALGNSVEEMEALEYTAARLQREPNYAAPEALLQTIKALVEAGTYTVFE